MTPHWPSATPAECDAQSGDLFQLVGIRINPNERVRLIPLGEIFQVQRTGISLTGSAERARIIDGLLNTSGPASAEGIVYQPAERNVALPRRTSVDLDPSAGKLQVNDCAGLSCHTLS
jgi:hypothetical protein